MLKSDFKRAILSHGFFIAIIGVCLLYLAGGWDDLNGPGEGLDVLYFFQMSSSIGRFPIIILILCTLPYSTSFCSDWNSGFIRYMVIRSNPDKYSWSKVISCSVSSGLSLASGLILFILVLSFRYPLVSRTDFNNSGLFFGDFLLSGNYIAYFLVFAYLSFLSGAFWSVVGLCISTYLPNRFVVLATPFIISYLLSAIINNLDLPRYLNLEYLGNGRFALGNSSLNLIYATLVFSILTIAAGYLFVNGVKRRLANG